MQRRHLLLAAASAPLGARAGVKDWMNGAKVGQPLPRHEMQYLQGQALPAGARLRLIDFWATWCAPCVAAVPRLNALHEALQGRGLDLVGLSPEPEATVRAALPRLRMAYSVAVDGDLGLHKLLKIRALPYALLTTPGGQVLWRGEPDELTAPVLEAWLQRAETGGA